MNSIKHKAMIAQLSINRWGATKTDRTLGARVEKSQDASVGTVRAIKQLMPDFSAPFHRLNNVTQFARIEHNKMTLPGTARNQRVLVGKMFLRHTTVMDGLRSEFYLAANNFFEVYPEIKRNAPDRMGKMYRAEDFPSVSEIVHKYTFDVFISPMPETTDWRIDGVGDTEIKRLTKEVEENLQIQYNNCHMEVYARMAKILERLSAQAKSYSGAGAGLQQSLFNDLKEISEVLPLLNIDNDPVINSIAETIRIDIAPIEPHDIRHNEELRNQIAKLSDTLLEKVTKK